MPRPKGSKNKINGKEILDEEIILEEIQEEIKEPISIPYVNEELEKLQKIHLLMLEKGIRDIGQLEVLISKLQ